MTKIDTEIKSRQPKMAQKHRKACHLQDEVSSINKKLTVNPLKMKSKSKSEI
jgi:hypothetical protein